MKMKRIGITVALLFCMGTGSLFAQAYKVVEKSDKKAPVWYESAESGYIVASAETGASLRSARSAGAGPSTKTWQSRPQLKLSYTGVQPFRA